MKSVDKIRIKNSISIQDKNNRNINKSLKKLNHFQKDQRSSTTHLNEYSKYLLLQKADLMKSSIFLKKQSVSTSNLAKIPIAQNKLLQNKPQQQEKLNKILQNLKKKKLNTFNPQTSSSMTPELKVDVKESRIIKTSQNGSRSSLYTKRVSIGKLVLGKNIAPQKIMTKQERWDPFYQEPLIISEDMITKKGVYNLINTGLLPSQYDFLELLNTKYQLLPQTPKQELIKPSAVIDIQDDSQTFMTNPALANQYEAHRKMSEAQLNVQQKERKQTQQAERKRNHKIRKTKLKKTKKVVNDPFQKLSEILIVQVPFLSIVNSTIEKDENYIRLLKQYLRQGNDQELFQVFNKMEQFSKKYQIKKFRFKPSISFGKKITQKNLIQMIQNFKILGYDKTINKKKNVLESVVRRAFELHHIKKIKVYLKKIENFKKYFRMRKFYYEYVERRFNFYKYRLESFVEQQRKYIQDFVDRKMFIADYHPKVEIHILTKKTTYNEEKSYYKLRQRLRAQLMRIFNSQPADIIFLVDSIVIGDVKQEMSIFVKMAMKIGEKLSKITNKLPRIHIFQTGIKIQQVSSTGRTYYGISPELIKIVREICNGQKPVVIPYQSSNFFPFICQIFNANLFGGTYTNESIKIISQNQNDQYQQNVEGNKSLQSNFKKNKRMPTFQSKISKFKNLYFSNELYEDKSKVYDLFSISLKKQMPFRISTKNKTQLEFYQEVAAKISSHKESTKWIFKLSRGKFSRGIALLQTNDLKVFQQSRKKSELSKRQKIQISQLMSIILKDKIVLSQPYLMEKQKFLSDFFVNQNSYIQEYVENSQKICVFGKILPNGTFIFMGTYKKYYTNGVGFGALYPAEQVEEDMIQDLKQISRKLGEENVFGYVTFEFLYQQKLKRFLYLDFTPNLDEYSSLFFLYDTLFKSSQMYEEDRQFNVLPRKLFYCPFLDNNGNKFNEIEEFLDQCRQRKVWYDSSNYQGQMFLFLKKDPSMLGLITLSTSEYQSIKYCIDAISLLVQLGGKFNQFDKKYMGNQDTKTDGLYVMDILWKLREIKKKLQTTSHQVQNSQNLCKNSQSNKEDYE